MAKKQENTLVPTGNFIKDIEFVGNELRCNASIVYTLAEGFSVTGNQQVARQLDAIAEDLQNQAEFLYKISAEKVSLELREAQNRSAALLTSMLKATVNTIKEMHTADTKQ